MENKTKTNRCPGCNKFLAPGRSTCGNSFCQEIDYHDNWARNGRTAKSRREHARERDMLLTLNRIRLAGHSSIKDAMYADE